MRVWAVANQKGGVGKTTTAVTLAGLLALRGGRTLLVDLDPHGSLTSYFGLDPDSIEGSLYVLFQQPEAAAASLIRSTAHERLRLMPASTAMATLDRQLGTRAGMGLILARALEPIASEFDHVLLDCPPGMGVLMVNALAACERLIIPVQTEPLALKGLERMLRAVEMIERSLRKPLPHLIVPTLYDRRTRAGIECLDTLRTRHAAELWSDAVPIDTQLRDAAKAGAPLPYLAPQARSVQAYAALLEALLAPNVDAAFAKAVSFAAGAS